MALGKKSMQLVFEVEAKKAKKDIEDVGSGLKKVGTGGKVAAGGVNMLSKGFMGIGVAIKAAGIGLFISLLAQLTGMFGQNQKTADTFSRIMIKLQPVFKAIGSVIEMVASALEYMVDLFNDAVGWIGDLIGVSDDAGDSTEDFAEDIVSLRNEVKLLNAELALTQLQYQQQAEQQRQLRDDTSKTIDERIRANERLGKVLEEQAEEERRMALKALDLAEKELKLEYNVENQAAIIDAKVKLAEIDERITGQRSEQLTNLNSLEQERIDLENEALEKRQEKLDEYLKLQNQDLKVKEEIRHSITEQLSTAKDAHTQMMQMLKEELAAQIKLLKAEEERRLIDIEQSLKNTEKMIDTTKKISVMNINVMGEAMGTFLDETGMLQDGANAQMLAAQEKAKQSILDLELEYSELMSDASSSWLTTEADLIAQAKEKLDRHFEEAKDKEIRETKEKYDELFGAAENDAERMVLLEEEKNEKLKEIDERYKAEEEERAKKTMNFMMDMAKKAMKEKIKIDKRQADAEKKGAMDSLKLGMGLAEKGTAAYKALASTETIISTYAGATRAFKDVPSPWNFIQAGLIIATGMKNLAEINKTKVEGGGTETMTDTISDGGGIGGDMGGGVPGITFGDAGIDVPPVQAYVVETDISNAQALQSELDLQSTL